MFRSLSTSVVLGRDFVVFPGIKTNYGQKILHSSDKTSGIFDPDMIVFLREVVTSRILSEEMYHDMIIYLATDHLRFVCGIHVFFRCQQL